MEIPLRGTADAEGQRLIKVNVLPTLLASSVEQAVAFYRRCHNEVQAEYAIPDDWTVEDVVAGELKGKRMRFSTREASSLPVVTMEILVLSETDRAGTRVYQLALKSPAASLQEARRVFGDIVASFRTAPAADSGGGASSRE